MGSEMCIRDRDLALHLNILESPSPGDILRQVWLKLAQWFWRKRFLKVVNLFLLFPNYLPLEKDLALHLNILESPSPGDTFLPRFVDLGPVVLEKKALKKLVFCNSLSFEKGVTLHLKKKLESSSPKDAFAKFV